MSAVATLVEKSPVTGNPDALVSELKDLTNSRMPARENVRIERIYKPIILAKFNLLLEQHGIKDLSDIRSIIKEKDLFKQADLNKKLGLIKNCLEGFKSGYFDIRSYLELFDSSYRIIDQPVNSCDGERRILPDNSKIVLATDGTVYLFCTRKHSDSYFFVNLKTFRFLEYYRLRVGGNSTNFGFDGFRTGPEGATYARIVEGLNHRPLLCNLDLLTNTDANCPELIYEPIPSPSGKRYSITIHGTYSTAKLGEDLSGVLLRFPIQGAEHFSESGFVGVDKSCIANGDLFIWVGYGFQSIKGLLNVTTGKTIDRVKGKYVNFCYDMTEYEGKGYCIVTATDGGAKPHLYILNLSDKTSLKLDFTEHFNSARFKRSFQDKLLITLAYGDKAVEFFDFETGKNLGKSQPYICGDKHFVFDAKNNLFDCKTKKIVKHVGNPVKIINNLVLGADNHVYGLAEFEKSGPIVFDFTNNKPVLLQDQLLKDVSELVQAADGKLVAKVNTKSGNMLVIINRSSAERLAIPGFQISKVDQLYKATNGSVYAAVRLTNSSSKFVINLADNSLHQVSESFNLSDNNFNFNGDGFFYEDGKLFLIN